MRSIELEPLPFHEARDLAKAILREQGADVEVLSDAIAHESGGNPYFLGALASRIRQSTGSTDSLRAAGNIRLDDMLWECVSQLPEPSRRLLEVVAIAGHPLREKDALEAARIASEGHVVLHLLLAACMIRTTPMETHDGIEAYHDRVREVVVSRLAQRCWRTGTDNWPGFSNGIARPTPRHWPSITKPRDNPSGQAPGLRWRPTRQRDCWPSTGPSRCISSRWPGYLHPNHGREI